MRLPMLSCTLSINISDPEQANRPDSRTREVQAESVAYAVCQHYGLDTSEYSFGYVAGWEFRPGTGRTKSLWKLFAARPMS